MANEIKIDELKPNSHAYKSGLDQDSGTERKRLDAVVGKDSVVSQKKGWGSKFARSFVESSAREVKDWLILDVIIPGLKNTILDILQMMFFHDVDTRRYGSSGRGRDRYDDRTNYSAYYGGRSSRRSSNYRDDRREEDYEVSYKNIILSRRDDAERVVEEMRKRIKEFRQVSVADLFDLVNLPGKWTDNNWGWTDARDIGIRRVSEGFLIDVAEPMHLD